MRSLRDIIDAMRRLDRNNLFHEEIKIIEQTSYRFKGSHEMWPKKATCYGKRKVDLPNDFYRRPFHDQSSLLISTAVHQRQIENHILYPIYALRYAIHELIDRNNNFMDDYPSNRTAIWICRIMRGVGANE